MQIIMNTVSRMTLQGFAEQHNLVMEINERDTNEHPNLPRYYASFEHCEVKGDGSFISGLTLRLSRGAKRSRLEPLVSRHPHIEERQ